MRKVALFSSTDFHYVKPVIRQVAIYESEGVIPHLFEVSTHSGHERAEWQFNEFKTFDEAQAFALQFMIPKLVIKISSFNG